MSRGPDAATLLARVIVRDAAIHGCAATVADSEMTRWASATFTGARHRLMLSTKDGASLDTWVAALPEADLPIPRHLIADVVVVWVVRRDGVAMVEIEALTVET